MFVIRPVRQHEGPAIEKLVKHVSLGITSLPRSRELIEHRINQSIKAFSQVNLNQPVNEKYLFAFEDTKTAEIIGVCGIYSKTGIDEPLYFYRIKTIYEKSDSLPLSTDIKVLVPIYYPHGPSEIGSLFLKPQFRKEGIGRLLSLSRFLFMATFPERFDQKVFALMRAFHDKEQHFPFWEGVGRHFIAMEYGQFIEIRHQREHFIQNVLAKYPVYVSLLTKDTQEAIGRIHPNTQPALTMLMKEGFYLTDEIDLFDGGPKVEAITSEIRTIKKSRVATVEDITAREFNSPRYLISNLNLDFRACQGTMGVHENAKVALNKDTADALSIKIGDKIRYICVSED